MESSSNGGTDRSRTIRVLHVDDDAEFAELAAVFLTREDDRFDVETTTRVSDALDRLDGRTYDCLVSDYDMPEMDGIEFLGAVRKDYPDLPFILYTGKGSEEVASDAISSGVTDYLQKGTGTDQYRVLANRITNAVDAHRTKRDLKRRIRQDEVILELSRDALEGVDLSTLFRWATDAVTDRLDTDYTKVLQLASEGDHFRLVAGTGWDDGLVGSATVGVDADSQAGYTLTVADPVVTSDLRTEERFRGPPLLTDHGVVSGVSVVIGSSDDPWGVLGTHATVRRAFTSGDIRFLQNVANVLGTAIERDRTEHQLREREAQFREIAELSPDPIFRTDTSGVFVYVSPATEGVLKESPENIVGSHFREYVTDESLRPAVEAFLRVLDGEVVRGLEVTLVDAEGNNPKIELSATPVKDGGEVKYVQGFTRVVSDRRQEPVDTDRKS